jgi:hypothetical protein
VGSRAAAYCGRRARSRGRRLTASMLREATYSSLRLGLYDTCKSVVAPHVKCQLLPPPSSPPPPPPPLLTPRAARSQGGLYAAAEDPRRRHQRRHRLRACEPCALRRGARVRARTR